MSTELSGLPDQTEFPEISVEVRFSVPPVDLPVLVESIEQMCAESGWLLDYPAGDGLPYEHTLPHPREIVEHDPDDPDWQGDPDYHDRLD